MNKWFFKLHCCSNQEPRGYLDNIPNRTSRECRSGIENIYAHESLTFNDTIAGLKEEMDARQDVYVLSNGGRKSSDDINSYYWEYTPDKAKGNVLEGHSILSLEGSVSKDCDVEKNGKWSYTYAVGRKGYQGVCTRHHIASAGVGMLDGFSRGLQTCVQIFVDFDYVMAEYMTLMIAMKEVIWQKGHVAESAAELKLVAVVATGTLIKVALCSRFQHCMKLLRIGVG
ncbi:hypothetical protein Tco_0472599 [Tanacetum coccineum]